jgi:alkanesulfonate monooxygenase SsuD/methylene tetrahydromethanopterin reductase-like flavin-dependent oxidoreductase (luciferase family)
MARDWQSELEELLAAYLSYQGIDAGVAEMVYVAAKNRDYHLRFLPAIESGIEAAKRQDPELLKLMTRSSIVVYTFEEALEYLEKLRSSYLRQYEAAIRGKQKPTG